MKLTPRQRQTLLYLDQSPRRLRDFTHGVDVKPSEDFWFSHLQELEAQGLAYRLGDSYHITQYGKDLINVQPSRATPRVVIGEGVYKGEELMQSHRPGSGDFLKCPSLMNGQRFYRKGME